MSSMKTERFTLSVRGETIPCRLDSPEISVGEPMLLINLGVGAEEMLDEPHFKAPAEPFWENGHSVVSLDLPCHGSRAGGVWGKGIRGFRDAFVGGVDIFAQAVREIRALTDHMLSGRFSSWSGVVICGCSRGGYLALRAFAADRRLAAASAVCPVTDWKYLSDFEQEKNAMALRRRALKRYAAAMAGRPVHLVIGGHDSCVSTASCLDFYLTLRAKNDACGFEKTPVNIVVTEDEGHTVSMEQRRRCGAFLLLVITI